jgi:L-ascorbate metabolism protein UlaG (beta-lactamase superfamily)
LSLAASGDGGLDLFRFSDAPVFEHLNLHRKGAVLISITHLGHACVLAEVSGGPRILFDPGTYSAGFEDLTGLDAILITHEHPDHYDQDRLPSLAKANPDAPVVVAGDAGAAGADALPGTHAVIHPDIPAIPNTAYQLGDLLFHPGDSFTLPSGPVRILLLPTGGPWMKAGEAIDYLRAVAPEIAIPIHQAGLAAIHQQLHYGLFRGLGPSGTAIHVLEQGTPAAF